MTSNGGYGVQGRRNLKARKCTLGTRRTRRRVGSTPPTRDHRLHRPRPKLSLVSTRTNCDDISNGIRHVPRIQCELHKTQGTVVSEQSCHATSCSERSCTTAGVITDSQLEHAYAFAGLVPTLPLLPLLSPNVLLPPGGGIIDELAYLNAGLYGV